MAGRWAEVGRGGKDEACEREDEVDATEGAREMRSGESCEGLEGRMSVMAGP